MPTNIRTGSGAYERLLSKTRTHAHTPGEDVRLMKSERAVSVKTKLRSAGAATVKGALQVGSWLMELQHAMSPVGKAESAYERGDSLFQIELDASASTGRTLAEIEKVGWRLEKLGSASEDGASLYLFRRADVMSS